MQFSEQERRTLERLDRQLRDDPDVVDALSSMRPPVDTRLVVGAAAAMVVGTIAMMVLLAVSYVASFAAFLAVLIASLVVVPDDAVRRSTALLRSHTLRSTSEQGAR